MGILEGSVVAGVCMTFKFMAISYLIESTITRVSYSMHMLVWKVHHVLYNRSGHFPTALWHMRQILVACATIIIHYKHQWTEFR